MAHRHKRETAAPRKSKAALVAGLLATVATGTAVTVAAVLPGSQPVDDVMTSKGFATGATRDSDVVSRSDSRLAAARGEQYIERLQDAYERRVAREAERKAIREADTHLWTTAPLNLWTAPGSDARDVGLVEEDTRVLATGRRSGGRAELVVDGQARWVTAAYLSADRPPSPTPSPTPSETSTARASQAPSASPSQAPSGSPSPSDTGGQPATNGLSTAPCPDSAVEDGLTPSAIAVHRAVCHAFPQIDTYLGYDPHGEHASGKALDIMTSDKALGDQIAAFLQSHAAELDLYDIIWWDRIWTPVRASEGWRDYGDHGSATANHMDHVHVATN